MHYILLYFCCSSHNIKVMSSQAAALTHEQQSHCQYPLPELALSQETNNKARLWADGLGDCTAQCAPVAFPGVWSLRKADFQALYLMCG